MDEFDKNGKWINDKSLIYTFDDGTKYSLRKVKKVYPGDLIFLTDEYINGDAKVTAISETHLEYFHNNQYFDEPLTELLNGNILKYVKIRKKLYFMDEDGTITIDGVKYTKRNP